MNSDKYKNIIYNLKNINLKINNFNKEIFDLKNKLDKDIKIDNFFVGETKISKIEKDLNLVSNCILEEIIPSLNNKTL